MFKKIICSILVLIGFTLLTSCYFAIVDSEGNIIAGGPNDPECVIDIGDCIYSDFDYYDYDNCYIYDRDYKDESISEQPSEVIYLTLTLYANAAHFKNYSNGGHWRTELQVVKGSIILDAISNSGLIIYVWYGEFRGWSCNNFKFISDYKIMESNLILIVRIGNYWSTWK